MPFGAPVEPDVNARSATSSGPIAMAVGPADKAPPRGGPPGGGAPRRAPPAGPGARRSGLATRRRAARSDPEARAGPLRSPATHGSAAAPGAPRTLRAGA